MKRKKIEQKAHIMFTQRLKNRWVATVSNKSFAKGKKKTFLENLLIKPTLTKQN